MDFFRAGRPVQRLRLCHAALWLRDRRKNEAARRPPLERTPREMKSALEVLLLDQLLHAVDGALAQLPAVHEDRRGAADLRLARADVHVLLDLLLVLRV